MTARSFVVSIAVTAVVCAIGGRCTAPDPAPLPAKTQARVTRHEIQSVIDSAETRRLTLERDRARRQVAAMRDTAEMVAKAGLEAHRRADELQALAIASLTAADSAHAWQAAHDARKEEADSLRAVGVRKDTALTIAMHGWAVTDSALTIKTGQVWRSDSLIAELLPLAQRRDQCRILGLLKCPSRKETAVVAVVTTLVVKVLSAAR